MASANEQIGIAQAAYYPTLSLSAIAGFQGTSRVELVHLAEPLLGRGPDIFETLFDAGRRRSAKNITEAQYDATVANYRQTVLTAFQQVEDNLAALRVLENEAQQQHEATASAEQSLDLFQTRYEGGVDTYLQVVTWQTAALNNQRNDLDIFAASPGCQRAADQSTGRRMGRDEIASSLIPVKPGLDIAIA